MSKPLIFLFLFQLIISIDLPNTRSVNNKVEVSENPINAIYKSIDNLFANYDIYQKIKNDFEDANVKLKDKRETIPDRYNNCLKTPYDYMLAVKFDKQSSGELGVKIFKDEQESLNFIKQELKKELSNKTVFPINEEKLEKVGDYVKNIGFKKNIWKKVDLIEPVKRKLSFLSVFFKKMDDDKYVIVYYYLKSEIVWCYEYFILINSSDNNNNSLLVFKPQILGEPKENEIPNKYKDILIRYFSILSYLKIHNSYGEGDFLLPELNV